MKPVDIEGKPRRHIELDRVNGFDNAIKECLENDILREYLQRKAREVINMLTVEYDYATDRDRA